MRSIKQKKIDTFYYIVMLFAIGCFLGFVFETILCFCQTGHFESRKGLIYGPFNPVYGFGTVALTLLLKNKKTSIKIVVIGAISGGCVEYICSWIQEKFFGTVSWDYKDYFLNFDGRTSIYHMIWWGILSVSFIKLVYPHLIQLFNKIKEKNRFKISLIIAIFFAIDGILSFGAAVRQNERLNNIPATNIIRQFFDICYPDSLMDKIYPNKMIVNK